MTDEQLAKVRELVAKGEKAANWPTDLYAGEVVYDTRHMENVGFDDDGEIIGDVAGGPELLDEAGREYCCAAMNAREALSAMLAERDALKAENDRLREALT